MWGILGYLVVLILVAGFAYIIYWLLKLAVDEIKLNLQKNEQFREKMNANSR